MTRYINVAVCLLILFSAAGLNASGNNSNVLTDIDVFELEYGSDPQISPDGSQVVYMRNFYDIMTDRGQSNIWIVNFDGTDNRPITTGKKNYGSPRWSPDGSKLLYVSSEDGSSQIYLRWMDTGQTAKLTNVQASPGGLSWSSDGKSIALTMFVPVEPKMLAKMPPKPNGAKWAEPVRYITDPIYRNDGAGFAKPGYTQIFILPVEGGTPRQLTSGDFNHRGQLRWSNDSKTILFSANRHDDWKLNGRNSDVFQLTVADGTLNQLTDRDGPDTNPAFSPDGKKILYTGYDDELLGYMSSHLYIMNSDGSGKTMLAAKLDRNVQSPVWASDSKGIYFQYDTEGNTKLAYISLKDKMEILTGDVGGLSLGRPYGGGQYTISASGRYAFTHSRPDHPADIAVGRHGSSEILMLTNLNADLFANKELAKVEEIWYESSFDGRKIQGWIATPPNFDANKKYPLILEIHGGPFANYGDRFASEVQLYAAAGYVVLYANPRGSTSYGMEFGNLIHHNYPSQDYDDLISGVDAVIKKGYIDENKLFVTGGSGGGVLSAWIVGKTNRFAAAVVAKPVINWYSWALTADMYATGVKYWFPGVPWENQEHYMKRSPISLVGNVTTPTMLLTGESDLRTPIPESEQFFQALLLKKVDTAMVRIPGAFHGITARPSNMIAKVNSVLAWFAKYNK